MEFDFSFENPTRIHFGKKALDHLIPELSHYGERILLVYGGGSVKRSGLYDYILKLLKEAGKEVSEFSGILSNPTEDMAYGGIKVAKETKPHLILAVGGGSVIDCAKVIAAGACIEEDFWDAFFTHRKEVEKAIPVAAVLTMVGTASEMNGSAVITHRKHKIKRGMSGSLLYPKFSILNPKISFTVPKDQMVSGICDILSHIMETYLSPSDEDNLSDDLAEAIMCSVIRSAYTAIENPFDYTARSNIMWASTLGLNGILSPSKQGDFMAHQIEHQIGAYTNCPHGLGLAAISASYYRVLCPYAIPRFYRFGVNVWGIDPESDSIEAIAWASIDALENFFRDLGAPTSLTELGMDENSPLDEIAASCRRFQTAYKPLTELDIRQLLQSAL